MSPAIALSICIVLVLFLLRIDHKQAPEVSIAFWVPTVWMLYIASKPLVYWFGYGGDIDSGSSLDQVFLSVLFCLGFFTLLGRRFSWSKGIRENIWVFLLITYMFVSVLWSDIVFISFKRWIRELIAIIMAFIVVTEKSPQQAMESLLRRSAYILIPFSLLLVKYYPQYGVQFSRWEGQLMWIGVTTQKNGLGRLCLISAFFLIWSLVRRWQGSDKSIVKYQTQAEVFILSITLWLLKGPSSSYSATSIGALVLGLMVFVSLSWMKKHGVHISANIWLGIMSLIIVYGVITPMSSGSNLAYFTSGFGRDETFTGRTDIWAGLVNMSRNHLFGGVGFGGFWTAKTIDIFQVNEAHNGYLQVLLELGYIGVIMFSMFLLSSLWRGFRLLSRNFYWGSLWICYLFMFAIHNITEASLNSFTSHLTALILFLAVSSKAATSKAVNVEPLSHSKKNQSILQVTNC